MSHEALVQIVERACRDAAFRAQLQTSPDSALAGYDLTADERAALRRDASTLGSRGVEPRTSKFDTRQEQDDAVDWLKSLLP